MFLTLTCVIVIIIPIYKLPAKINNLLIFKFPALNLLFLGDTNRMIAEVNMNFDNNRLYGLFLIFRSLILRDNFQFLFFKSLQIY